MPRTLHTITVFPMHVVILTDVIAIELSARKAWVHTRSKGRVPVARAAFSSADLATERPAMELAMQARKLTADANITLTVANLRE